MNLLNIKTKDWNKKALKATAPGLLSKLGKPSSSHSLLGKISKYYVGRYGFNKDT